MKINMNNNGININGETRMADMPNCFIFCVDGNPLSAWKKVYIDNCFAAQTTGLYKNVLYMNFFIGGDGNMELSLIDKSALVKDVFDMDKASFIPVDSITIDEVSVNY